jgi:tyrosinase
VARVKSGATVATFSLDQLEPGFRRAEARFEGLRPPVATYSVRVFADEPNANASTPTDGNPHYLGTQHFYGLGVADVPPDPSDPYRLGRASQSARTRVPLNVTKGMRAYLAQAKPQPVPITLVAVDRDGKEIPEPDLDLEGFSIVTK